ncbi:glial cell line-derived neurotrophic factor [Chanos chanos]|uniref:Glial cell line-derived neurotrophic factor n=1 Tax=Chanos chanos TaxID=29144 RepID=A0A6J2W770_CHACN|nr:neurturin [Chanos chanos]
MRGWKCSAISLTLCAAALSLFSSRTSVPTGTRHLHTTPLLSSSSSSPSSSSSSSSASSFSSSLSLSSSSSPTSSSSSSSSSSAAGAGAGEASSRPRSVGGFDSVLSEFLDMFQSFTESDLKQLIGTLADRKTRRASIQSKRTKRAKKPSNKCSLKDITLTVTDLGLGYISNETINFRYCSGNCMDQRRNYDLTLKFLKSQNVLKRQKKEKVQHLPCCRPVAYEKDISFLDNSYMYHTIKEVSARRCGCF